MLSALSSPPRVLSLIPPMTQLNTPYPSTAYITGFLRSRNIEAHQCDIALQLVLRLFTPAGLSRMADIIESHEVISDRAALFLDRFGDYERTITPVIRFLQGRDSTLAHRIAQRNFLPEGPRFDTIEAYVDDSGGDPLAWAFGSLGVQDRARHLATLYLNDLSDVIADEIDSRFAFVRYAESLAGSQPTFDPLANALAAPPTLIDELTVELALQAIAAHPADLVLLSVPFPGAVYGALRIAQAIRQAHPHICIAMGGGYVNTELRSLSEPRIFDHVHFITLDAGEKPLLSLIEHLQGKRSTSRLQRTYLRDETGQVQYVNFMEADIPFEQVGTPTWDGLPIHDYLSLLDMLNPMHRLWSDGRWNKLTVAHGCYWKKCSFCDVSLDYISRFDAASADELVKRIDTIVEETGQTGFHFVDEAAPPKSLKALAHALIERGRHISWWGNVRFEKTFTPDLCQLLADSGCIAISGGLEVASDRLLQLMKKGVSVAQVARVTKAFSDAGILVHAYLMYGFPTQTEQETVDALEYVRQLFEHGCIQSGFWHRFACTVHSPVGQNPQDYGVELAQPEPGAFARNDIAFIDPTGTDHEALGHGLNKALYNYMHGIGLDTNVRQWFDVPVPKTRIPRDFIARALAGEDPVVALGTHAVPKPDAKSDTKPGFKPASKPGSTSGSKSNQGSNQTSGHASGHRRAKSKTR